MNERVSVTWKGRLYLLLLTLLYPIIRLREQGERVKAIQEALNGG